MYHQRVFVYQGELNGVLFFMALSNGVICMFSVSPDVTYITYMLIEARIPHSTCYQLAHHWMVKFAWGIPAKFRSKPWSQDFCQSSDQFGMLTSKLGLTGKLVMMCFFLTAMWVPGSKFITWPKSTADSAGFEVFINQIIGDLSHCDVIDWCFAAVPNLKM